MSSVKGLRIFNLIFAGVLLATGFVMLFVFPGRMDDYMKFAEIAVKILLPLFLAAFGGSPLKKALENQKAKIENGK